MDSINNVNWSTNSLYLNPYAKAAEVALESEKTTSEKEAKQPNTVDSVTLSNEIAKAKTRELIGLNPVGKLKLKDFESAFKNNEIIVESKLEGYMAVMGIDKSQEISLTLDEKSNIIINETFAGKDELEKALNEDNEFLLSFQRMSSNDDILTYVDDLKTNTSQLSLINFMSSGYSWDNIMSSASISMHLKNSDNPLESLLSISKRTPNYSFNFNVEEKA